MYNTFDFKESASTVLRCLNHSKACQIAPDTDMFLCVHNIIQYICGGAAEVLLSNICWDLLEPF